MTLEGFVSLSTIAYYTASYCDRSGIVIPNLEATCQYCTVPPGAQQ